MDVKGYLTAYEAYHKARQLFLTSIGCAISNRDPIAEFSEHLVAVLVNGELAKNRVQKDYDVISPVGEFIQVKYLTNPKGMNVNGLEIRFLGNVQKFAVVYFEDLHLHSVLQFDRNSLDLVYDRLGKRHKGRGDLLLLLNSNVGTMLFHVDEFKKLGVDVLYQTS